MFTRTPTRKAGENTACSESGVWEQSTVFGSQDFKSGQDKKMDRMWGTSSLEAESRESKHFR